MVSQDVDGPMHLFIAKINMILSIVTWACCGHSCLGISIYWWESAAALWDPIMAILLWIYGIRWLNDCKSIWDDIKKFRVWPIYKRYLLDLSLGSTLEQWCSTPGIIILLPLQKQSGSLWKLVEHFLHFTLKILLCEDEMLSAVVPSLWRS